MPSLGLIFICLYVCSPLPTLTRRSFSQDRPLLLDKQQALHLPSVRGPRAATWSDADRGVRGQLHGAESDGGKPQP